MSSLSRASVLKSHSPMRRRIYWTSLALLVAVSFATATIAQPQVTAQSLSLQNALQLAEQRSHALFAQDASARASEELAVRAGQLPDPILELSVDNLPVNGSMAFSPTEDFMTMRRIGISQTFTREDKRRARANVFERRVDKAQITKELTLTEIRQNTALAWLDSYYQHQMVALLIRQKHEASIQVQAAEAAYRANTGPQSDIFLAKTTVAEIQDRIHQVQTRLENAKTTLARWVGDITNISLDAAPDITQSPLDTRHLAHQISQHPDIAVMKAEEMIAEAEAEVARQERHVDWTWSVMYGERSSGFSDMISIGVSVPLQWNQENRQDRMVAAKLAKADQVRAEREEMIREHIAETERWLATWQSNLVRLNDYEASLIPLASQRTDAAVAEYRGGEGELVTVLDARKMEIATRIESLRIKMETAALWATLEYLTLPDDLAVVHPDAVLIPQSPVLESR